MRTPIKLATAVLAISAAACSPAARTDSAGDDFKRDLQLASATNMDLAAPAVNPALITLETVPGGAPKVAKTIKKHADGDHAVPSPAPTVEASPEATPAPAQQAEPVAQAPAPAPVPEESNEPVAVAPRPLPVPVIPAGGAGAGDYGRGGGVFGPGTVVIRGGSAGDDHCDPHGRRGGGIIFRSPVYVPQLGGPTPRGVVVVNQPKH